MTGHWRRLLSQLASAYRAQLAELQKVSREQQPGVASFASLTSTQPFGHFDRGYPGFVIDSAKIQ